MSLEGANLHFGAKKPDVRKFASVILGPEKAASILWAPGSFASFCKKRKTSTPINFLILGGVGYFVFFGKGGSGSTNSIFMCVGIFQKFTFWRLKLSWGCFLQKGRKPQKGGGHFGFPRQLLVTPANLCNRNPGTRQLKGPRKENRVPQGKLMAPEGDPRALRK